MDNLLLNPFSGCQQPTGPKKLVSKMLTICLLIDLYLSSILSKQTTSPKISKHFACYLLAIRARSAI